MTRHSSFVIRHSSRFLALALVMLGFALRLYALGSESLWYDELLQLDIAQGPLLEIFPRLRGHSGVPLDYLIGHFWIMLGRSDGWVRLPAVVAGTLTLPVAYRLGRHLLRRSEALVFLGLLALMPFHIRYSQEVRPYALVVLGVTLALYAFWQLLDTGRWRYFWPLQAGVLIFSLAHIFATVVFLPLMVFGGLCLLLERPRKRMGQALGGLVLSGLAPLLIFAWMGWGDVLFYSAASFGEALVQPDSFAVGADKLATTSGGPALDWPFYRDKVLSDFVGINWGAAILFFNLLVGLGLVVLFCRNGLKRGLLLLLWIVLPPAVIISFLVFRETFFAPRYIISITPAYLMLLAVGLLALPRWMHRAGRPWASIGILLIVGGVVLFTLVSGLARYYGSTQKENWHLAADFIASNASLDDAVIALSAEPTMSWYYPPAQAVPNYYKDLDTVKQAVAQARRSWVITSIFSSGSDAQVKAWLSEQQAIRFALEPVLHVYYLGHNVPPDQLLAEIQNFALPVDHALYASLARENRRRPEVARQYYRLAIQHAPTDKVRAEYQAALQAIR